MDPKNPPRDYAKLTHGTFEMLRGPLKWLQLAFSGTARGDEVRND